MHLSLRGPRRVRFALLAAVLAVACAHAVPAHAAGTYIHQSCVTGNDLADASSGWQMNGYSIEGNSHAVQCPAGGLRADMSPEGPIPVGATVGWTYIAPPQTTISRFSGEYAGWAQPDASSKGVIEAVDSAGTVGLRYSDNTATAEHHKALDWVGLTTTSITARIRCASATGNPGCIGATGWASFYTPKLYLADHLAPTAGATSGSITTDTTLTGDETLGYSASDDGGGIARLRLYVDGEATAVDHVIDTNNGHCERSGVEEAEEELWIFSWPKPCPSRVDATETIDTTAMADGQHTITAKVVDAAQQDVTVWSGSRLVINDPPANTQLPALDDQATVAAPVTGAAIAATGDGTWSGLGVSLSRAWVRCDGAGALPSCAAIPNATGPSYTPTAADIGHRLRLRVTATNAAGSATAHSQPTGAVAAPASADPTTPDDNDADDDPNDDPNDNPSNDDPNNNDDADDRPSPPPAAPLVPAAPVLPIAPVLPVLAITPAVQHTFRGHVVGEPAGTACPQDRAALIFEHVRDGKVELAYGKASTAQVRLTCTTTGKAIDGAQLDITTRIGTRPAVAADVTTDGAGHATLRLAKGAGRTVTVGYRMYADDRSARATATLKVTVRGKLSLKADHRHLRNGQAVTLRGTLAGGEVPKRGVTLAVQWKDGHRWRPFAQIKTTRKGTFRYAYRFTRTAGKITYALRVQVTKGQVDYPYLATASKPVKVTVAR